MEKCANCGMPIVPCAVGYTHMPDGWIVECDDASPTRTVAAENPVATARQRIEKARDHIVFEPAGRDLSAAQVNARLSGIDRQLEAALAALPEVEKGKATADALTWLIAASVEVTIGVVSRGAHSELRVALDLEGGPPMWYGDLTTCLLAAMKYCESEGITP